MNLVFLFIVVCIFLCPTMNIYNFSIKLKNVFWFPLYNQKSTPEINFVLKGLAVANNCTSKRIVHALVG